MGLFLPAGYALYSSLSAPGADQNPFPGGIAVPPELPYVYPSGVFAGPTVEEQVVEIVNQERWANGALAPLKKNGLLDNSSETHSSNMGTRNFFMHCDPDTLTTPGARMTAAGYAWNSAGENIAAGSSTPASVMALWMGSSGHRANILSTTYREIGVGYVNDATDVANVRDDTNGDCTPDLFNTGPWFHYWTQNFGRRTNGYPVVINREAYQTASPSVSLYVYGSGFATEMRFRNDTGSFSPWEPYNANKAWTLSSGAGLKEVFAEIRNGAGTVLAASDTIELTAPAAAADFFTVTPCRVVDTRGANGPLGGPALGAGSDRTFTIPPACGIPVSAVAISVNVAVTGATVGGNLRLHPAGTSVPLVSSINYIAGATRSNNGVVPLNGSGQIAAYVDQSSGVVHFILDVNGYFQ